MQVILKDGPLNGKPLQLEPGTYEYRLPVAKPVDVLAPFDAWDIEMGKPNFSVALYRFSGLGLVDPYGACRAVVFEYVETYDG